MTFDPRVRDVGAVRTALLFDIVVDLEPQRNYGSGAHGRRVFFGAAGGAFEGPALRGTVERAGGDWALFRADGVMLVDVRLTLRTHDDALVHMTYGGRFVAPAELRADMADPARRVRVDPTRYYFRTAPVFETGAARYVWLNDIVCVGSGYFVEDAIAYRVDQVL